MIVFYSKVSVIDTFNIGALLTHSFECVTGMRDVPDSFKNIIWDGSDSGEWKCDRNYMTYEIDNVANVVAFRVAIVDANDELWTIDMVLKEDEHNLQFRLAREKKEVSADYDREFNIPYMFKKLMRDGVGGIDVDIPISDKPIFINSSNCSLIEKVINREVKYELPIIFVSHLFNEGDYTLDVYELSKDMAGSAHVIVEESSEVSSILKFSTDYKNAYNGAIDVFYNNSNFFRYLNAKGVSANQYRYRISHAVYSRMAMRNIDEEYSLSAIKLRNKIKTLKANSYEAEKLAYENVRLKEQIEEKDIYIDMLTDEYNEAEQRANQYENENFSLLNKNEALMLAINKKKPDGSNSIFLDYTETQYYDDEVKRFVLLTIKKTISMYGDEEKNRRDYHILKDIIDNNIYADTGDIIKKDILRIFRKNSLNKSDSSDLKSLGFELENGAHDKYIFHNDDRYIITVSNTPSDHRGGENLAHDAVKLIFGRTGNAN